MGTAQLASRVSALCEKLISESNGKALSKENDTDRWYLLTLLLFIARAKQNLEATILLSGKGFGTQALMVARSSFEMAYTLLYIKEDIAPRITLFVEYEFMEKHKFLLRADKHKEKSPLLEPKPEMRELIVREYERIKKNYPDKRYWAGIPIRDMAVKAGHEYVYDFTYAYLCEHTHNSVAISQSNLKLTPENTLDVISGSDPNDREPGVPTALAFALVIAEVFNEGYGLNHGAEISEFNDLMKNAED